MTKEGRTDVLREQLLLLEKQLPGTQVGATLGGPILAVGIWDQEHATTLIAWLVIFVVTVTLRYSLFRKYKIDDLTDDQLGTYAWWFSASMGVGGLVWGIGGAVFSQHIDGNQLMFLMIVFAGMAVMAFLSISALVRAYQMFIAAAFLPLSAALIYSQNPSYQMSGIAAFLCFAIMWHASRTLKKYIYDVIELRLERAELIEKLSQEKRLAEESGKAKSRFFAAASHDLRQPLNALHLFVDALMKNKDPTQQRHLCNRVNQSTLALNAIVDGVLDISKIESGTIRKKVRAVMASDLFSKVVAEFSLTAKAKGLTLKTVSSSAVFRTDPELLLRVLHNLVANAIRYTDAGGVLIGCRRSGPGYRIEVVDTGRGVPLDHQTKIFEEFYQIENPERAQNKGLGLGLSIVKGLCELLGHDITVKSTLGKGTVFGISVPSGTSQDIEQETPEDTTMLLDVPKSVLIIDDDALSLEALTNTVSSWGHITASASSVSAAIQVISDNFSPEIVITDFRLQDGKTGLDALAVLHEIMNEDIPAIIVTGDTDPERIKEAGSSGLPLLHKPINPAKLRALINSSNVGKGSS